MSKVSQKIEAVLETVKVEEVKFENGNASAGTRLRKALQELITIGKESRKEIQETKNAAKAK